ncbi:MAG: hypothetical protein EOO03_09740 [Chitinophagaceae bacterium]|nr:MAG: hypothetical protein EOO03_09740 [Chitinophagaceae bacterium]
MKNKIVAGIGIFLSFYIAGLVGGGCAQIGAPTGGMRDSLAPVLVKATPGENALNVTGNRITLNFDEYIELYEMQNNLLISPLQKNNPIISSNLKTVSIRLRDSLLPNTTYSIQFGNAIKDINEGNVLPNFTYVFSTGNSIDSLSLAGTVLLAETGKPDTTINVLLYRNSSDTAVEKLKPDYMARTRRDGSFIFNNLPASNFRIFALKDGDGSKNYSSKSELFAFTEELVSPGDSNKKVLLNAYAEQPQKPNTVASVLRPPLEKRLKFTSSLQGTQDLLGTLTLSFNNPLTIVDSIALSLRDTNYVALPGGIPSVDSSRKILTYAPVWTPGQAYTIVLPNDALQDAAGNKLPTSDSLRFAAKTDADYGRVIFRFANFNAEKKTVLQLVSADVVRYSFTLTDATWQNNRIAPGEYEIRILQDSDGDGKWTTGSYDNKRQPEKATTLPQKLSVKADWDNERDLSIDF